MYRRFGKRFIDFTSALILFLVLMPIIFLLSLIIFLASGLNPFFFQDRPGKNGKIFSIIKFRTMTNHLDSHGNLLNDQDRLFGWGKFIRKTSLDEIPQLLNVIKGEMSLIGPRPLLPEYLRIYSKEQSRRHEVKPGITGWAQVNGRNGISWEQKFIYDLWYIENYNFSLDLKIICLTFINVFNRKGINSDNNITMEKFTGNN